MTSNDHHILIIDREPTIAVFLDELLSDEGYRTSVRVAESVSGNELVQLEPDLILVDVPPLSPTELEVRLQRFEVFRQQYQTPIIVITTYGTDLPQLASALESQHLTVLYKPFDIDALLEAVSNLLNPLPVLFSQPPPAD